MTFRETLREFLRRTREILDNNRAEGNISWIDDVMYFIEGKTRIRITEHFPDKGKRVGRKSIINLQNAMENETNLWYNMSVSKYCTIGLFRSLQGGT